MCVCKWYCLWLSYLTSMGGATLLYNGLYLCTVGTSASIHSSVVDLGLVDVEVQCNVLFPRHYGGAYSHSPISQQEQDVGMGQLFPPTHKLEILDPSLKLNVLSCQDQLNRMPLQ